MSSKTSTRQEPWAANLPMYQENVIPEVAKASDEALLSAMIVLTHGIHQKGPQTERLRYERELVKAEVLRRMGDQR